LLFRATRRGTHELDILIGGFVTPRIAAFTEAEIDALETILDMPEPDLADLLAGRRPIPADSPLLRAIREAARR
jgi:antitoxin CptB